ncbi:MAG: response regulator transcription factor, partial [Nocardioidaceae bacterium]
GSNSDPSLPGEHLTDRELDVLRMLASRLTLREIAEELFISVNTLKFHLKVIYRKLGVNSREEAAQLSRRMSRIGRQHQPSDAAPLPAPSARGR